jgi:hypothetical protein
MTRTAGGKVEGDVLAAREGSDAEVCREELGEDGGMEIAGCAGKDASANWGCHGFRSGFGYGCG